MILKVLQKNWAYVSLKKEIQSKLLLTNLILKLERKKKYVFANGKYVVAKNHHIILVRNKGFAEFSKHEYISGRENVVVPVT